MLYSCEEVRECSFCESGRLGCFNGDNTSTSGNLTIQDFFFFGAGLYCTYKRFGQREELMVFQLKKI